MLKEKEKVDFPLPEEWDEIHKNHSDQMEEYFKNEKERFFEFREIYCGGPGKHEDLLGGEYFYVERTTAQIDKWDHLPKASGQFDIPDIAVSQGEDPGVEYLVYYFPPFHVGSPLSKYQSNEEAESIPLGTAWGNKGKGTIEIGCFVTNDAYQFAISHPNSVDGWAEANGRIGIYHLLPPGRSRRVYVQAYVSANALFRYQLAEEKGAEQRLGIILSVSDNYGRTSMLLGNNHDYNMIHNSSEPYKKRVTCRGTRTPWLDFVVPAISEPKTLGVFVDAWAIAVCEQHDISLNGGTWSYSMVDAEGSTFPNLYPAPGSSESLLSIKVHKIAIKCEAL